MDAKSSDLPKALLSKILRETLPPTSQKGNSVFPEHHLSHVAVLIEHLQGFTHAALGISPPAVLLLGVLTHLW